MKFVPSPLPSPLPSAAAAELIPLSLPIQPRDTLPPPPPAPPTCYHPNGQPSLSDLPCSDTHSSTHTFCCPPTYTCSSNRICFPPRPQQSTNQLPIRASCTDETWTSDACPGFCISDSSNKAALKLCAMKTDETVYCCISGDTDTDKSEFDCECNDSESDDSSAPLVTVAMYESLSRPAHDQLNTDTDPIQSAIPTATATTETPPLATDNPLNSIPNSPSSFNETNSTGSINTGIFSPHLPRPLTNLYTALIVLGCVWCISAFSLLAVLVVVRVRSWRRGRENGGADSDCVSSISIRTGTRDSSGFGGFGNGGIRGRGSMFWSGSKRMAGLWFAAEPGPKQGPGMGMVWKGEGDGDPFADVGDWDGNADGDVDHGNRGRASTGSFGVAVPIGSPTLGWTSLHAGSGNGDARRGISAASSRRSSAGSLSVSSLEVVVEEGEGEGEEDKEGKGEEDEKKDAVRLEKGNGNRDVQMWEKGWRGESTEEEGLEEADIGVAIGIEDNHRVGLIWRDDVRIRS